MAAASATSASTSRGGQVPAAGAPVGLTIIGNGNGTGTIERGVDFENGARILDTQNGLIKITGNGSALGTDANSGVYIDAVGGPTQVKTLNGSITITGTGGGADGRELRHLYLGRCHDRLRGWGSGQSRRHGRCRHPPQYGRPDRRQAGTMVSTTTGNLTITGTGGDGLPDDNGLDADGSADFNAGVVVDDGAVVTTTRGVAELSRATATARATTKTGSTSRIGAQVTATQDGSIKFTGTASAGGNNNNIGVFISEILSNGSVPRSPKPPVVSTLNGSLSITGKGGGVGVERLWC